MASPDGQALSSTGAAGVFEDATKAAAAAAALNGRNTCKLPASSPSLPPARHPFRPCRDLKNATQTVLRPKKLRINNRSDGTFSGTPTTPWRVHLTNLEAILAAWEGFARTFWPGPQADSAILRNDAELMLRAVVEDMGTSQTLVEQKTKSEGRGRGDPSGMNRASLGHALARVNDGFDIGMMVAEFRALRASVFRIWWETNPVPHPQQIEDMGRFNEALDQLIAGSVVAFTRRVDTSRQLFLSMLGHDLRQPLGSLRMLTDVVAKPERLPSGPAPVTATMRECCDAMARMMDDLLDFTTTQRGESIPVTTAPTDLRTICEELLKENAGIASRPLLRPQGRGQYRRRLGPRSYPPVGFKPPRQRGPAWLLDSPDHHQSP